MIATPPVTAARSSGSCNVSVVKSAGSLHLLPAPDLAWEGAANRRYWGRRSLHGGHTMNRVVRCLLIAVVAFCLVAPSASAAPASLGKTLGQLWTTVLETPTPDNPFGDGGPQCVVLGGKIVAPFGGGDVLTCTVKAGTRIFIGGWTTECSTFAGDDCGGPGFNEAQLRAAAEAADAGVTATVTINGQPVPLSSVETGLLTIHLPQDNIFGAKGAERNGLSVAHGFVYLTDPLTPGTYFIEGHVVFPDGSTAEFTTTIIVQ